MAWFVLRIQRGDHGEEPACGILTHPVAIVSFKSVPDETRWRNNEGIAHSPASLGASALWLLTGSRAALISIVMTRRLRDLATSPVNHAHGI